MFNLFTNQLSSIIEWKNQSPDVLWFKYPSSNNEIKNASKLIVAPGQGCVLVYEGEIKDVITNEGIFNLETDNHPFITTLTKLRTSFNSEHKLYIYFYKRSEVVNQKWGTPGYIKYIDPHYKFAVELGANGNFSYMIDDIKQLYINIIGSNDSYTTKQSQEVIFNRFMQTITTVLAQQKLSYNEIDANLANISKALFETLNIELRPLGLKLTDLKISGTTFDDETHRRISNIADISAESQAAAEGGLNYVELEKLRALRDAARNEGGIAGAGLQMGVGLELGRALTSRVDNTISESDNDAVSKLKKLKLLVNEDLITQEEYEAKKKEILSNL